MGKRRGRTGRGWDAAPPRTARAREQGAEPDGPAGEPAGSGAPSGSVGSTEPAGGAASDPVQRAREICLRQLAVRPRTREELATTLRRHGVADEVAAEVLDRYHEVGMIDDAAFAQAWVSSRHHGRGLARRALGSELRRRGVAPETVGEALEQLGEETEWETARALVRRRLRGSSGADPQVLLRRLAGMLARKGYPAGVAFRVVKEALAEDERTAELADRLDVDALVDAAGDEAAGSGDNPAG